MGLFGKGKGKEPPRCATCNGTGRVQAPWVPNRNIKSRPGHGHGPTHTMKRTRCPSCGGTGHG